MNNSLKREAMQELLVRFQHNMITRQQFFAEVERLNHTVKRTIIILLRPLNQIPQVPLDKIPLKKY